MRTKGILDRVSNFLAGLGGFLLIFLTLIISAEVVMRYLLHRPISWAMIASESILLYVTFLAATWILRQEGHVRVEILTNRLSPRTQVLLEIISSFICAGVCLIFVVYGIQVTLEHRMLGMNTGGLAPIPTAYLQVIIPICSIPLFIEFIRRGYRHLERWRSLAKDKNVNGQ